MEFLDFKRAVQRQFKSMIAGDLFSVNVDKDALWAKYLSSYPEGTNPKFRERTEYDCSCCRAFIKNAGNIVTIKNGVVSSIWDINVGGHYQVVSDALSKMIKAQTINNIFLYNEKTIGTDQNKETTDSGVVTWEHFHITLPDSVVVSKTNIGPKLSDSQATQGVMLRSLSEISYEALDTVLELISQNSLYRGEEHKALVDAFYKLKKDFDKAGDRVLFSWENLSKVPQYVSKIRNTVIGTLLSDLSEGIDLEKAVASFESKVAPTNYKRPISLVTKTMLDSARKKIEELGYTSALERRFAVVEDITVNNVLFADRTARKQMNDVFDEIAGALPVNTKKLDKVEEVPIEKFIQHILPTINSFEVMVENKHTSNLVSLISPKDVTSKSMFKWDNNFSWSYNGNVTDSIKERVKAAGGKIDGYLRCSLSWFNLDDLDLHMQEPGSGHIYYGNKRSITTDGTLDVDMNAGHGTSRSPVENIVYTDKKRLVEGDYKLYVNQYSRRETADPGFEIEIEIEGTVYSFAYTKIVNGTVHVATIHYSKKNGITVTGILEKTTTSKNIWNINTATFNKVSVLMLSPNYWDSKAVGNKHYFFMLDGCQNDMGARGFFNEFLSESLTPHRKVLEILGSKMKIDPSENQLSGLGFSSTQRNELLVKVNGSFSRTIKLII